MGTRGWRVLKRTAFFGLFFTLAVYSGSIYDEIRTNDIPATVPQQAILKAGQGVTAVISSIALVWNFFGIVISAGEVTSKPHLENVVAYFGLDFIKAGTLLFISFVDFLISCLLFLGVGLQANYLPHSLAGCDTADQWGVEGQGNITGLFRWVSTLDGDAPYDACQDYMTTWVIGIVLGCVAILSLISSYEALQEAKDPSQRYLTSPSQGIDVIGNLIRLIPRFVATPLKYSMRWLQKRCGRWSEIKKKPEMELNKLSKTTTLAKRPSSSSISPVRYSKFLELVSSYPIMISIAEGLHYTDLIELSMVSKSVREAIFPASNAAAKSSLEQYCCEGIKLRCWSCSVQVCKHKTSILSLLGVTLGARKRNTASSCGSLKAIKEPITASHLDNCAAYCSKCFRTRMCNVAGPRELSPRCNCNRVPQTLSVYTCRGCFKLDNATLSKNREESEQRQILGRAKLQQTCASCRQRLAQSGPRWWGCKRCAKECRSKLHPQWAVEAQA